MECLICGKRPRQRGEKHCRVCAEALGHKDGNWWAKAHSFAVWRGFGVAFMPNGKDAYKPVALPKGAIGKLPKARTINLDAYVPGYTRDQVKKLKAAIKACNNL